MSIIKSLVNSNNVLLIVTLTMFILDFISGLIKALYTKSFNSEKFRKTIPKCLSYIIMIAVCGLLDISFDANVLVRLSCIFIIITEATSIIENIDKFVSVPKFLTQFLEEHNVDNDE